MHSALALVDQAHERQASKLNSDGEIINQPLEIKNRGLPAIIVDWITFTHTGVV